MFTTTTIRDRRPARLGRLLAGATCALALTGLLSGSAFAFQMRGDYLGGGIITVQPKYVPPVAGDGWRRAKLRTTAGYEALVRG